MDLLVEKLRSRSSSLKFFQFNTQTHGASSLPTVKLCKASEAPGVLDALLKRWRKHDTTGAPASKRVSLNPRACFRHYHGGGGAHSYDEDMDDCAFEGDEERDDRDDQDDQGAETFHVPTEASLRYHLDHFPHVYLRVRLVIGCHRCGCHSRGVASSVADAEAVFALGR